MCLRRGQQCNHELPTPSSSSPLLTSACSHLHWRPTCVWDPEGLGSYHSLSSEHEQRKARRRRMRVSAHRVVSSHCNTQRSLGACGDTALGVDCFWLTWLERTTCRYRQQLTHSSATDQMMAICHVLRDAMTGLFQEALSFNDAVEISNHGWLTANWGSNIKMKN